MKTSLKRSLVCLVVLSGCGLLLNAQQQFLLPQVGNGTFENGSIRTTFILFNPTSDAVEATIRLRNDAGNPLLATIPDFGTTDQFGPFTLESGASMVLQTDGSGALSVGSALVESSGPLGVSAVFSLFEPEGNFQTEAGVGNAEALTEFVIPVDAAEGFNTGLALVNPGETEASITYRLIDTNGQEVDTLDETLGPRQHRARFVRGENELFPEIGAFQGTLEVTSTQPLGAITLRQNDSPLSFTTLPVFAKGSTQTSFNLPQVASGTDAPGILQMRTTFVIFNLAETATTVDFNVRRPDGTAFPLIIPGKGEITGAFSHELAVGGSAFLQTDGSGPLSIGSAQISATGPIGVSAIFTLYSADGSFLTEAGVGDSPARTDFTLPIDVTGTFNSGVAFFNPGDAPATISVRLLDEDGNRLAEAIPFELAAKGQTAKYVSELFSGQSGLLGSLAVSSSGPLAAVTLRQNSPPLTFTTLPVVEGTANGTLPSGASLLSQRQAVDASSDITVDAQLAAGFVISGILSGRIATAHELFATNEDGEVFMGQIDHTTGEFQIVVPAGTYNLSVCYQPRRLGSINLPNILYTDPASFPVNINVTRDLAVPDATLATVSGEVAGLDQLPDNTGVALVFSTADGSAGGTIPVNEQGEFEGTLAHGTYTPSLVISDTTSSQPLFSVFDISPEPIVITGRSELHFAVPERSTITGRIRMSDLSAPPADSLILATEPAAMGRGGFCTAGLVQSAANIDAAGNYEIILANQRSYRMSLFVPIAGGVLLADTGRDLQNLSGNRVEDFMLPALPDEATISGRVTDPQGQGLMGVTVVASAEQLAAGLSFFSTAVTDDDGNYTLTVLAGADYTVTFTPPSQQE